jgi:hypothetical protein
MCGISGLTSLSASNWIQLHGIFVDPYLATLDLILFY